MKPTPLLALAALAAPLAAQIPRPSSLVDASPVGPSVAPGFATAGNLSVLTYLDGGDDAYYAVTSDATGLAWSAPVRIDRDTTGSSKFVGFQESNETVYVSGDHVYVTWRDDRNGGFEDVYFNRSIDGGATFEPSDQRISTVSPPGISSVRDWSMVVSRDPGGDPARDKVYVLMSIEVAIGGPEDLVLTASLDGGTTFGPSVAVSSLVGAGQDVDDLSIAAIGSNVYCTWVDDRSGVDDQFVSASNDGGLTFGPEIVLSPLPGGGNAGGTSAIDADPSGRVLVAFEDRLPGQDALYAAGSVDFGATWSPTVLVGNYTAGVDGVDNGQLAIRGPHVLCVWRDDRTGDDEVYAAVSLDDGLTWLPDVQLSTGGAGSPRLTADGVTELAVVWSGGTFPEDSFGVYSLDNGLTFTGLTAPVSDTAGDSDFTEVAYNAGLQNVLVCWLSDDTGGNRVYAGGFSICGPGTVVNRSAAGNPDVYAADPAVLGGTFIATVDASATGHALTAIVGFLAPFDLTLPGGQVVLVDPADPGGELLGLPITPGPLASYAKAMPNDPALCNRTVFTQGVLVGGVMPYALTNAQDVTLAAY